MKLAYDYLIGSTQVYLCNAYLHCLSRVKLKEVNL